MVCIFSDEDMVRKLADFGRLGHLLDMVQTCKSALLCE